MESTSKFAPTEAMLNYPHLAEVLSQAKEKLTLGQVAELLQLSTAPLRSDLQSLIKLQLGKQKGKSVKELESDKTVSRFLINNCLTLLTDVGGESSLPVVLDILRQSDDILEYNNIIASDDYTTQPVVTALCEIVGVNVWKLKPFLLEESTIDTGKQLVMQVVAIIGSAAKSEGDQTESLPQIYTSAKEVLSAYIADIPTHKISDKALLSQAVNMVSDLGISELAATVSDLYRQNRVDPRLCDKDSVLFGLYNGGTHYSHPVNNARDLLLPDFQRFAGE